MTGLHLSTVGMSVRNALVMLGAQRTAPELMHCLSRAWPVAGLEVDEIAVALAELERRGLVRCNGETYEATDPRFFRARSREQDGMSEDDHWQGWTT